MWQSIDRIIDITKRLLLHFLDAHLRRELFTRPEPINQSQKSIRYTCDMIKCVDVCYRLALLILRHSGARVGSGFHCVSDGPTDLLTSTRCPLVWFFFFFILIHWLFALPDSLLNSDYRFLGQGSGNKWFQCSVSICINYFHSNAVGTISTNPWRKKAPLTLKYIRVAATSFYTILSVNCFQYGL